MDNKNCSDGNELVIECADFILREYRSTDVQKLYSITQQPHIREFLPDWVAPLEKRKEWIEYEKAENRQFLAAASKGGHVGTLRLRLAIELRSTAEFIGWCCTGMKDEIRPPKREIVYGMSEEHLNRGYTTQAARALVQYLFARTDTREVMGLARVDNIGSNRVLQKSGFSLTGTMEIAGREYNHYLISKGK